MQLRAGDQVDHYTLVNPLGEGGQGSVWKVIDPREGGVVRALKLVHLEEAGRQSFDRARREAKILAAAKHPALVVCHGLFEDLRAGLVGLVMDLVPGCSLAAAAAEGRLDADHCFAALEQILSVLAYVHSAGLVHRDLKPENVLLANSFWENPRKPGAVKLVDFGIAAPVGNPRPLTSVGAVVGTIPYMAPELVDPASWGRAEGPARDVFAFGVMTWEILFGKHPTGLAPHASMIDYARAYKAAHAGRIVVWPPQGLDGAWGVAVGASLGLRPADRPANGAALLEILRTGTVPSVVLYPASMAPVAAATAPHRSPTRSMTAEQAPIAPASFARVASTAPPEELPPEEPIPMNRVGRWWVAALTFIVSIGVAAAAVIATGWFESKSPPMPAPVLPLVTSASPRSTSAPLPPPSPTPPILTTTTTSPEPKPCCRPEATCRGPTRFSCPRCNGDAAVLTSGKSWWLRVAGVTDPSGHDMTGSHRSSKLCMSVSSERVCAPFTKIASPRGDEDDRLQVTTDDVEGRRIHFTIDGSREMNGRVGAGRVRASALCEGLFMYLDDANEGTTRLSIYLDPTTSQGP